MPHFESFSNISAKFDSLIKNENRVAVRIPVSEKRHISASITRIGLFKTGGIDVELVSISKSGALFRSTHHSFTLVESLGKDMTIELSLDGEFFEYEANIVRQDTINDLYGVKFNQHVEAMDDYLVEFSVSPDYGFDASHSVWFDLATA
jgi:hypothetical protein